MRSHAASMILDDAADALEDLTENLVANGQLDEYAIAQVLRDDTRGSHTGLVEALI